MGWLQDHGWAVGVIAAALVTLVGLAWWSARRRPATPVPGAAARRRVDLTFAAAVLVTLAVGWAAVLWLLEQADQVPPGKDRAAAQADAVKTGATIALGTGGAAYLLLAYRRQRLEEVDTQERRITELYTGAVEQLGHEKAPVRLGALYSLERLAQDNPEHRPTVVDVFCAYLRMPFTPPARTDPDVTSMGQAVPSTDDGIPAHPEPRQDPTQEELQVRRTAQRILTAHLCLPPGISSAAAQRRRASPRRAFWRGISLDLTGAALVHFRFVRASVIQARFDEATFQGDAEFGEATFQRDVEFDRATFQGEAGFQKTTFQGYAGFRRVTFQGAVGFRDANFQAGARFDRATFKTAMFGEAAFRGGASFDSVIFDSDVLFRRATFEGGTTGFSGAIFQGSGIFDRTTFQREVGFEGATFKKDAVFSEATFQSAAWFDRATFQGSAWFDEATFEGTADFNRTAFQHEAQLDEVQVLHLDDEELNKHRAWPGGLIVRPDPADPSRGTLVRAEDTNEPEPAVPPSDPTESGSGTG